jgi:hypothetical protein
LLGSSAGAGAGASSHSSSMARSASASGSDGGNGAFARAILATSRIEQAMKAKGWNVEK